MRRFSIVLLDDDGEDMGLLKDALVGSRCFDVLAICTSYGLLRHALEDLDAAPDAVICDLYMEKKTALPFARNCRQTAAPFSLQRGLRPAILCPRGTAVFGPCSLPQAYSTTGYASLAMQLASISEKGGRLRRCW